MIFVRSDMELSVIARSGIAMRVVRVDVEHNHRRGRICFGLCGQLSAAMSSSERHADVDLGWLFDQVALCVTVTLRCVWYCVCVVGSDCGAHRTLRMLHYTFSISTMITSLPVSWIVTRFARVRLIWIATVVWYVRVRVRAFANVRAMPNMRHVTGCFVTR
jgi:hypothetical protein